MSTYRICGDSQIGKSHEANGTVCQDSHHIIASAGFVVAAVADGLGSSKHSDIASEMAARGAVEFCAQKINIAMSEQDVLSQIWQAFDAVNFAIKQQADGNLDDFDTTLTLAVFMSGVVFFGHAGDSGIIALRKDGFFEEVTQPQLGSGYGKERPVYPLAADSQWVFGKYPHRARAIFLMTDGMLNKAIPPLLENQMYKLDHAYLYYLYDNMKKNSNVGNWVKDELDSILPGEINYDDKTLVMLMCNSVKLTAQPKGYYEFPSKELWEYLRTKHSEGLYPYKMQDAQSQGAVASPLQGEAAPHFNATEAQEAGGFAESFGETSAQGYYDAAGSYSEGAAHENTGDAANSYNESAAHGYIGDAANNYNYADGAIQGYGGAAAGQNAARQRSRHKNALFPFAFAFSAGLILGAVLMSVLFIFVINTGGNAGDSDDAGSYSVSPPHTGDEDVTQSTSSGAQQGGEPPPSSAAPTHTAPETATPQEPLADATVNIKGEEYSTSLNVLELSNKDLTDADIKPLTEMTNLTELHLTGNQITDVSVLGGLTNLTVLTLRDNQIADISALRNLNNLTKLSVGENEVSDISVLGFLPGLKELSLSGDKIGDISVLSSLSKLTELSLTNDGISNMGVIGELTGLTRLQIWSSQISDISFLGVLTNLDTLSISGSQISDISVLGSLSKLENLALDNVAVSDYSVLGELSNLKRLALMRVDISEEQLADIKAILPDGCAIIGL